MSQFYNSIAEKYDAIFPLSPAHKVFFDAEVYGKTVLDVGAGTGNLTAYLRAQGYDVTAIDLSKALIAQATAKDIEVQELNMLAIDTLPMLDTIINIGNTLPTFWIIKTKCRLFLKRLITNSRKEANLSCKW